MTSHWITLLAITGFVSFCSCTNVTTTTSKATTPATTATTTTTLKATTTQAITTTTTAAPTTSSTVNNSTTTQSTSDSAVDASTNDENTKMKSIPGFSEHFSKCKRSTPEFDKCIMNGINSVQEFYPKGVPSLNIPPFDPIYAKEVLLKRGGRNIGYKLKLKNVRESGWKVSEITKFRSNLKLNTVQLTQYFPDKYLEGEYEFESMLLMPSTNKGQFNMSLYELNQTTTLSRPRNSKLIKVNVDVQEIGNLKLHISNLLRGRTTMENILDRMINSPAWRPGFVVLRPFINELVSTAFTEIYNKVFGNFDFDQILPPSS